MVTINSSISTHVGKLASKALKVAHFLLNKLGGGKILKPGDRVRRDLLFVALMKDITQYT